MGYAKSMKSFAFRGTGLALILMALTAADDTTTFTYDALGRLSVASTSGGPSGAVTTNISYDPAGNRASYQVSSGGAPTPTPGPTPTPTPTPVPTPTPSPSAPVPLNPTFALGTGASRVITLATLASTSSAAAIIGFAPPTGGGSAAIAADGQSVNYVAPSLPRPPLCEPAYTNTYDVPYAVQNTPGGASASGVARMNVTSQVGPRPGANQQCPQKPIDGNKG